MCKLGDKTFKKNEEEIETDMAREEIQVSKIRDLIRRETDRELRQTESSRNNQLPKGES